MPHFNHICTLECVLQQSHVLSSEKEQNQRRENLTQEILGISRAEFIKGLKSRRYTLSSDAASSDESYPENYNSLIHSLTDLELLYVIQALRQR